MGQPPRLEVAAMHASAGTATEGLHRQPAGLLTKTAGPIDMGGWVGKATRSKDLLESDAYLCEAVLRARGYARAYACAARHSNIQASQQRGQRSRRNGDRRNSFHCVKATAICTASLQTLG
jgi:hypothetical protein